MISFQELIIVNTNLSIIDLGQLQKTRNLRNLSVINNRKLTNISSSKLKNAENIVNIDFSNNAIESIPKLFLDQTKSLQSLSFSNNRIQSLESFQFGRLSSLENLDLSFNNISSIHTETFARDGWVSFIGAKRLKFACFWFKNYCWFYKFLLRWCKEEYIKE